MPTERLDERERERAGGGTRTVGGVGIRSGPGADMCWPRMTPVKTSKRHPGQREFLPGDRVLRAGDSQGVAIAGSRVGASDIAAGQRSA
jgi:hypothetical protein